MHSAQPSRTAMRVAIRRAAHQIFDAPPVLDDPLALAIIGAAAAARLAAAPRDSRGRTSRSIRAFMAVRSRFAEGELARAVERGTRQYVVLGAGLDTFAYRNPYEDPQLRVFEVDHPATQAWKLEKLAIASISIPPSVTFAPVDFEQQTLAEGLTAAGFDHAAPAFFSWLGVTMYLTDEAIASTLRLIASTPRGGTIVFDYAVPRASLGLTGRLTLDALTRRVAAAGEPFRTFIDPFELPACLAAFGFHAVRDLGRDALNARYFADRRDGLRIRGDLGHLASAEL